MAALVCMVLMLAMVGASDGAWCVCRSDVSDTALQKTLDYACGAGADCSTLQQGGACYNPNTVRAHCSYAVNSYYQRKGQSAQACDFSGTAVLSTSDPSASTCTYPASSSSSTNTNTPTNTSTSPTTSSPTTTVPGSTTPSTTFAPPTSTSTGTGTGTGGVLGGLGPSGNSISTDPSPAPALLLSDHKAKAYMASGLVLFLMLIV